MKNFLKLALPSALIAAFGLLYAWGQTSYRSIQLSQDLTGVFQMDAKFGIYLPQHLLAVTQFTGSPTLTGCGSGSPAVLGSDVAGTITEGTSSTSCGLTFAQPYLATPYCLVVPASIVAVTPFQFQVSAVQMTITSGSSSSQTFNYICIGTR